MQNQINIFFLFILNGILIGLLFDFFRILRKTFNTINLVTYLQDIVFWVLTGVSVLYSTFMFNNGEIRLFMVLAIFIGIILYIVSLSKYIIKINVFLLTFLKNIFIKSMSILLIPIKLMQKSFRTVFIKPISFCIINIRIFSTNFLEKIEKKLKKSKKYIKLEGISKKM